jgi:hypothetical protein
LKNNERIDAVTELLKTKTSGGSANPLVATTDEEMTNLLVESNTGKVVKFTGTAGTYETDTLYLIEGV